MVNQHGQKNERTPWGVTLLSILWLCIPLAGFHHRARQTRADARQILGDGFVKVPAIATLRQNEPKSAAFACFAFDTDASAVRFDSYSAED